MSDVVRLFSPFLLWLALFSGVYALHGLGCGLGWPGVPLGEWSLHRVALVAGWVAAITVQIGLLALLVGPFRSPRPFAHGVSVGLAVSAVIAVGWTLFPVIFASSCS
jgi:hypothetical protein